MNETDFVLFERSPAPPQPSIAVLRPDDGARRGELVLSDGAWKLLADLAAFLPQVVKRSRAVELLFDERSERTAIRPVIETAGTNVFQLVPAFSADPERHKIWPMKIPCWEFLDHWGIAARSLHRPAIAYVETGLLVFRTGPLID